MPNTALFLRTLPLFRTLPVEAMSAVAACFATETVAAGTSLVRPGRAGKHVRVLVAGEVSVRVDEEPAVRVVAPALVGETSALTGSARMTEVTATVSSQILSATAGDLESLFDKNPSWGLAFYRGALEQVSGKLQRDAARSAQTKKNLVRTQKSLKDLREQVLAAKETAISALVCDALESLIEQNRRAGYRVVPSGALYANLRVGESLLPVVELSAGYIKLAATTEAQCIDKSHWAGVFQIAGEEIVVSGSLGRSGKDGVVLKLDPLLDESRASLDAYLTRLQLLDVVV